MARAEIKLIECSSLPGRDFDWQTWVPDDPHNVSLDFVVHIGLEGEPGSEMFYTTVATRRAIKERPDKSTRFKGFMLDPFITAEVEPLLRQFVSSIKGELLDEIWTKLRERMGWEYDRGR
ncbi:MAG: Imm8 family immunity protein [Bacillota bacterium]